MEALSGFEISARPARGLPPEKMRSQLTPTTIHQAMVLTLPFPGAAELWVGPHVPCGGLEGRLSAKLRSAHVRFPKQGPSARSGAVKPGDCQVLGLPSR